METNEITIGTAELKKSMIAVCRAAEKKSTIEILSHVQFEATSLGLVLTTTDLEVTRSELLPYANDKTSSARWTVCVDAMALKKALPKSAQAVKLSPTLTMSPSSDGSLTICTSGVMILQTLPTENFPMLPAADGWAEPAVWLGGDFRNLVSRVLTAISKEDSRYQLSGALFELNGSARAVATNGHVLHCADSELRVSAGDFSGMLPRRMLALISQDYRFKALGRGKARHSNDVHMSWSEYHVWIETHGVRYTARILEGSFPDYERVIKKGTAPCTIETTGADLITAVEAVAHCCNKKNPAVRLSVDGDLPVFTAKTVHVAKEGEGDDRVSQAEATLNGSTRLSGRFHDDIVNVRNNTVSDPVESKCQYLGLNPAYVLTIAKLFPGVLDLSLWNENTQAMVTGPEFRAVIMPIRL